MPPLNPREGVYTVGWGNDRKQIRIHVVLLDTHRHTPHGGGETGTDHLCSGIVRIPVE